MTYSSTFKVGIYTCTITFASNSRSLVCKWSPREPPAKSLSKEEIAQYRAVLDHIAKQETA
jgi:hypothetical protein